MDEVSDKTPMIGKAGFTASMIAMVGLIVGFPLANLLLSSTVLLLAVFGLCVGSVLGIALNSYTLFTGPCRIAKWGLACGLFVSLFIPTAVTALLRDG